MVRGLMVSPGVISWRRSGSWAQILGKLRAWYQLLERLYFFPGRCIYCTLLSNSCPDQAVRERRTGLCCSCVCQDRHCSLCWCVCLALFVVCVCLWENMFNLHTGCICGQGTTAASLPHNWGGGTPLVLRVHIDFCCGGPGRRSPLAPSIPCLSHL